MEKVEVAGGTQTRRLAKADRRRRSRSYSKSHRIPIPMMGSCLYTAALVCVYVCMTLCLCKAAKSSGVKQEFCTIPLHYQFPSSQIAVCSFQLQSQSSHPEAPVSQLPGALRLLSPEMWQSNGQRWTILSRLSSAPKRSNRV
nr:uncharacterized protein LOC108085773 isoform X2 [Drosophila kikkawai]